MLTHAFWQLTDMLVCMLRVPVLKKVWALPPAVICFVVLPLSHCVEGARCSGTAALTVALAPLLQAMGRPVSEGDFATMLLAGTHVVLTMKQTASVAECTVPPDCPSMVDTNLGSLREMGRLLQSCGPDWWVLPSPHQLVVNARCHHVA